MSAPPRPPPALPAPPMCRYQCACGGFLFASDAPFGRVEGVLCLKCRKRQTVLLGGRLGREQVEAARRALDALGCASPTP